MVLECDGSVPHQRRVLRTLCRPGDVSRSVLRVLLSFASVVDGLTSRPCNVQRACIQSVCGRSMRSNRRPPHDTSEI